MSRLLSADDVGKVVERLAPAIEEKLAADCKRPHLHLIVLDPASPAEPKILYEHSFGNQAEWKHDYRGIAFRKARLALRLGVDTSVAIKDYAHALEEDDPPFSGGVNVCKLVVAASGVEGYHDEMIARWVAADCRASAQHRLQREVIEPDLDAVPAA